jgi:putative transposase
VKFDPQKHHRRSIRLKGYPFDNAQGNGLFATPFDFAQGRGWYFITLCTKNREMLLGESEDKRSKIKEKR